MLYNKKLQSTHKGKGKDVN